ncbi:ABC transporter permease subunit [Streptomyces sp. VRA16 Mangrove soil]|uniref:ABC transporter permease subunit n=1 Tax=Streptomyces sp. VRA16 Mangrove soil TaxID=2817434 RepID=UPI0027DC77A4|nr:ABC transporter permease subunit [Streptomyces sp. VRA16 Mangrove soil]
MRRASRSLHGVRSSSREIEEAARADGAGVLRTYWSVVLPIARPALITLTILSFQGSWNEFTHFVVTTQSADHATLTTGLAQFVSGGLGVGTQYPLKLTAALLATVPVAIVFFAFRAQGVTSRIVRPLAPFPSRLLGRRLHRRRKAR